MVGNPEDNELIASAAKAKHHRQKPDAIVRSGVSHDQRFPITCSKSLHSIAFC
jgi:hypothetical protein